MAQEAIAQLSIPHRPLSSSVGCATSLPMELHLPSRSHTAHMHFTSNDLTIVFSICDMYLTPYKYNTQSHIPLQRDLILLPPRSCLHTPNSISIDPPISPLQARRTQRHDDSTAREQHRPPRWTERLEQRIGVPKPNNSATHPLTAIVCPATRRDPIIESNTTKCRTHHPL